MIERDNKGKREIATTIFCGNQCQTENRDDEFVFTEDHRDDEVERCLHDLEQRSDIDDRSTRYNGIESVNSSDSDFPPYQPLESPYDNRSVDRRIFREDSWNRAMEAFGSTIQPQCRTVLSHDSLDSQGTNIDVVPEGLLLEQVSTFSLDGPQAVGNNGSFNACYHPVSSRSMGKVVIQTEHGPALLLSGETRSRSRQVTEFLTESPVAERGNRKFQRWSEDEDAVLRHAINIEGSSPYNWKKISTKYFAGSRSGLQCKSRWTKSLQPGLVRGAWQQEEDAIILELRSEGFKWAAIAERLTGRIGEHVRDRYVNFLDPNLKKTPWTKEEDFTLFEQQRRLGNKWTEISKHLPGRSENAVKNRWHNAKMTQRRRMRKQAAERSRRDQREKARSHYGSREELMSDNMEIVGI